MERKSDNLACRLTRMETLIAGEIADCLNTLKRTACLLVNGLYRNQTLGNLWWNAMRYSENNTLKQNRSQKIYFCLCQSVCLCLCLLLCLLLCLCLSLSLCLSVSVSVCLSVYLSLCLSPSLTPYRWINRLDISWIDRQTVRQTDS